MFCMLIGIFFTEKQFSAHPTLAETCEVFACSALNIFYLCNGGLEVCIKNYSCDVELNF